MNQERPGPHHRPSVGRDGEEGGYILILTALLLIPLIAITALAIDIGAWYVRAQANQRAADAAALAGVVWLPDMDEAVAVAREAALKNGYQDKHNSSVIVERAGANELRVKVATTSPQFFTHLFLNEFAITRAAVAEYVPPVALGSPNNSLGTGNLSGFAKPDGFWLAASGRCSAAENGDLRLAQYTASYTGSPGGGYPPKCGGDKNAGFNNASGNGGYVFAIEVGQTTGQALNVEVYDGTYFPETGSPTDIEFARIDPLGSNSEFKTRFTLYAPDATPFDLGDNPVVGQADVNAYDSYFKRQWRGFPIAKPVQGTYFLRVDTPHHKRSVGSNGFALRAFFGGAFTDCSSITSGPTCPRVYAVNDLPLYASLALTSDFYLAEIDPRHGGKTLQVTLFDVGEGANGVEILDPNGHPVHFTWETPCTAPIVPPSGGCSGSGKYLDTSGTGAQPGGYRMSASRYNDRSIVISIPIPVNYPYSGNWWKVRYHASANMTDRTTWSVKVLGDPVRLAG